MAENLFNDDDRQYLQMMQDNITRMASNSSNCKTWMITLVAGFCAIGCSIEKLNGWIVIAVIPVIVFWYLDTFYLQLERKMRNRELDFIIKARTSHTSEDYKSALFNFAPLKKDSLTSEEEDQGFVLTNNRAFSKSIRPFYLWIIIVIVAISIVLNFKDITSCITSILEWVIQFKTPNN